MDAMALCLALGLAPLVPPHPDASGWHMLAGPASYDADWRSVPPERWYWDAALRVWRLQPGAFLAETPQQMACDQYRYAAGARDETVGPAADVVAIDGSPDAPRH